MLQTTKDLIEYYNTTELYESVIDLVPDMISALFPIVGAIAIGFFAVKIARKIMNV